MDDIGIYDRALSASEMASLANTSTPQDFNVLENAVDGTLVGFVHGGDVDGDALTYTIQSQDYPGAFAISSGGEITVADSSLLDHETATSHNVVVRVSDGTLTHDETFTITLTDAAEAEHTVPGAQSVVEDGTLTFSTGNGNAVSVTDTLAGDNVMQVTLSANDGLLTLSQTTGLSFINGSNGTSTFTFNGTESDINTAMEGMTFTPNADFNGAVTLNVTTALAADLAGHYTFEGNANDVAAGTPDNGTLTNGASIVNDPTRGDVLSLNNSNQYVEIAGMFGNPADVTLAAWVNVNSGTFADEIISLGDNVALRSTDTANGLRLLLRGTSGWQTVDTGVNISGNGWTHVAATVNDTTGEVAVYIDGTLVISATAAESIQYSQGTVTRIGQNGNGSAHSMDGLIDDARIYTRALTADEIASLATDNGSTTGNVAITVDAVNDQPTFNNLDGNPTFVEDSGTPVVLDTDVTYFDIDIDRGEDNYDGMDLTLVRNGGANSDDVFSATGNLVFQGNNDLDLSGTTVGTVTTNSGGTLHLAFNASATAAQVNEVLQSIAYSNNSDMPPASVQIDWSMDDSNGGSQGSGGNLFATGSTTVDITPNNDAPITSVTADSPTFTENGGAVGLFSGASVDLVESGDLVSQMVITVDGVVYGSHEKLIVDGHVIELTDLNSETTSTNAYDVNVTVVGASATVTISKTGGFSAAAAESLLNTIAYNNTSEAVTDGARVVTYQSITDDGGGTDTTSDGTASLVTVNEVNDDPVLVLTAGGETYLENASGVIVDAAAVITDADSTDYSGGQLTVTLTAGGTANDRLTVLHEGTGGSEVEVVGNSILIDTTLMATFSGGAGVGDPLVISFTVEAGAEEAQAIARRIAFSNVSDNPSVSQRVISMQVTDGSSGTSASVSRTMDITPVNDDPAVINLDGDVLNYTEGDAATVIEQGGDAFVTDVDSSNFAGGTLTVEVDSGLQAGEDVFAIRNQGTGGGQIGVSGSDVTYGGTIIGSFTGGTGVDPLVVTFNSNADAAAVSALAQNITYVNTNLDNPTAGARSITIDITDGDGGSSPTQNLTVNVAAVNDQAIVDLNGSDGGGIDFSNTFTEGGAAVNVSDSDATISDVDNSTYNGLGINLQSGFADGTNEKITIAGYTFSYGVTETVVRTVGSTDFELDFDGSGFTITRDGGGVMPQADLQLLLRGITYENTSSDPTSGNRTIEFAAEDAGNLNGLTSTSTITVATTNDAPVITGGPDSVGLTETNAGLSSSGTWIVSDADTADVVTAAVDSVAVSGSGAASVPASLTNAILQGFLSVSPTAILDGTETTDTLTWDFNSGSEAFDFLATGETLILTYTVSATDDAATPLSDTETVTITITGSGDAPVVTIGGGDSAADTLSETNTTLTSSGTLTVSDLDLSDSVTSAVSGVVASGTTTGLQSNNAALLAMLTSTANVIDGTELTDTLTWDFNSGSEAFDYLAVGESLTLTYTITVTDSQGATDTQDVTITINGSSDAPVVTIGGGDSAADTLSEMNTTLTSSGTLTVSDLDLSDSVTSTVSGVVASGTTTGLQSNNAALLAMLTSTANVIDGTELTDTLTWDFNSAGEAFDYLAVGESLTLTYTITVTDSQGATDTQDVTITINGSSDAPIITIGGGDSAADTLSETNTTLTSSGTLTVSDLDLSDSVTSAVSSVVASGTTTGLQSNNAALLAMLTSTANVIDGTELTDTLTWDFNSAGEAFDYLAVGESLTLTYTITVTDSQGATDTQDVTITINGSSDAPVITIGGGDSAADTLAENNVTLTSSGTLTVTDLDLSDSVSSAVSSVVASGTTTGLQSNNAALLAMLTSTAGVIDGTELTDTLTWDFNSGSEHFDYLAAGESLTLTYTITVTDSQGATDTQDVTITINGGNDAPVITIGGGDSASDTLAETNSTLSTSGTLTVSDVNQSDTVSSTVSSVVASGTTTGLQSNNAALLAMLTSTANVIDGTELTDTLTWDFNSAGESFDYLAVGESLTLTYTITVTDSQGATDTQDITITITGSGDAPNITIGGGDSAADTLSETNTTLTSSGTLTVSDLDLSDSVTSTVSGVVASGTTTGLQSNNAALLAMLTSTAGVIDGTELTDTLTWDFNSAGEAFDYLAVGETLTLTYTITVTDSQGATDTQDVTITINGSSDAPLVTIGGGDSAADTLSETNTALTSSGTLTVSDLDLSDSVTSTVSSVVASGTTTGLQSNNAALLAMLTSTANVIDGTELTDTLTWDFNSAGEAFDYLAVGESLTLTYTITVTDSQGATDTQDVTITINGSSDAPIITIGGGDSAADTLSETNTTLTSSGTLTVSDLDLSDSVTSTVSSVVASGTTTGLQSNNAALLAMLTSTANVIDGTELTDTLTWDFNSAGEAFDYLAVGETLTLTYTITATDSQGVTDTQDVTITINGSGDAPVITVGGGDSAADTLAENNVTLTSSGTLTVTDLDLSDSVTSTVSGVVASGTTTGLQSNNAALLAMLTSTANVIDATELTDTLTWNFNSGSEHFDYLAAGESLTLTYTITVTDSQGATDTQDVVITINGGNDAPMITVGGGDSAADTLAETNTTLTSSGTLTVSDVNLSDTVSSTVSSVVAGGTTTGLQSNNAALLAMLTSTANVIDGTELTDTLAWDFNSAGEAFDYLAVGETLTLTYTITVTDSQGATDTQDVTITINGSGDAPVVTVGGGDSAADTLSETNTTLTSSGTLTVSDLDLSDSVTSAVSNVATSGTTTGLQSNNAALLAMLTSTANVIDGTELTDTLTWNFNSAGEAFDYLAVGETLTLTYTITVTDSQGATDTQDVTITINRQQRRSARHDRWRR